ncbi:MAG: amidohydrolase [Lachnospiraceae bacterium]|nr:amidohydrolase [Lachnospiraceae bacterium]
MIIDAHVHLWKVQQGLVDGRPVREIGGGRADFGGEIRQMLPPYLTNGENTAEILLSNMDFAGVNGAVVTQEQIDGSQNAYLREAGARFPERLKVSSLYEEGKPLETEGFSGVKICAGRLAEQNLLKHEAVFERTAAEGKFLLIDLAEGDAQTKELRMLAEKYPRLRIAIGHFGMAERGDWLSQIRLAELPNVRIESGGITWLYTDEFWPYPSAVKAFRTAIGLVGAKKLMWGSDYPRTMTAITYRMSLDFLAESAELDAHEKALILGENAREFYGFPKMPPIERIRHMAED